MIGIDTSFLCSLFVRDNNHEAATQLSKPGDAFSITPLVRLEFRNALNQQIMRGRMTALQRDRLWRRFEQLVTDGVFVELSPSTSALHEKARELSDRHTAKLGTRSLDLLHVAAAILLEVEFFYTFDERQRQAAMAEGLAVFP